MSIGNKAADRVPEFDYHHDLIHHVSNPNPYRAPHDMDEAEFLDFLVAEFEDKILSLGADNVAAFFAEPIMLGRVIIRPRATSSACGNCARPTTSCSSPTRW